jgi:hypothetical protein
MSITRTLSCNFEWCSSLLCSSTTVVGLETVTAPAVLNGQKGGVEATAPANGGALRITCRSAGAHLDCFFVSVAAPKF